MEIVTRSLSQCQPVQGDFIDFSPGDTVITGHCYMLEGKTMKSPKYTPGTPEYREYRRQVANAWNHAHHDKALATWRRSEDRKREKRIAERAAQHDRGDSE